MSDSILVSRAIEFAAHAHRFQVDKQGQPYIFHLLAVAREFEGVDDGLYVVAILHDIVEDTHVTLQEIETNFGPWIAHRVDLLTHLGNEPYGSYLGRICQDMAAVRVKIEDVKHNISRIHRIEDLTTYDRLWGKYGNALRVLYRAKRNLMIPEGAE